MEHKVVRNIKRPSPDAIKTLGEQGTATVHEAQGRIGLLAPYMRPIYNTAKMAGPAVTVSCQAGDNLMIHAAVEVCKPGDVLVVTTKSPSTDGMFGELIATSLIARGVKASSSTPVCATWPTSPPWNSPCGPRRSMPTAP